MTLLLDLARAKAAFQARTIVTILTEGRDMTERVVAPLDDADRFYFEHGPCCSGCDWWDSYPGFRLGACHKNAPGPKVHLPPGWEGCSAPKLYSEWPITMRDTVCGDFRDTFDWAQIPGAAGLLKDSQRKEET